MGGAGEPGVRPENGGGRKLRGIYIFFYKKKYRGEFLSSLLA